MAKLKVVDVDGVNRTLRRIQRDLNRGMEESAKKLADIGKQKGREVLESNDAIFNTDVFRKFKYVEGRNSGWYVEGRLINHAEHAGAVEWGVPASEYADGGPPIQALLPWVERKLSGWDIDIPDGPDSGGGSNSGSSSIQNYSTSANPSLATNRSNRVMDSLGHTDSDNTRLNGAVLDRTTKSVWNYRWKNAYDPDSDTISEEQYISDINWIEDKLKSWKSTGGSSTRKENAVRYAKALNDAFAVSTSVRGESEYDIPDTSDSRIQRLVEFQKMSHRYLLDQVDDDNDGFITTYRAPQHTEISRISKEIWENPRADSWEINLNTIMNYSDRDSIFDIFDRGMRHTRETDVEKEVLIYVDAFIDGDNNTEREIHIRGDRAIFDRDGLEFSDWNGDRDEMEFLYSSDFYEANFQAMSDTEIDGLRFMIMEMDSKDVSVDTIQSKERLSAWVDELIDRGFVMGEERKWKRRVNNITDGYYAENGG